MGSSTEQPTVTVEQASNRLVSIGVPVYNGEDFLTQALDSLLSQTHPDLEIVISDNASTDGTEDICRAYAAKDGRISYHRQPRNLGAAPNYNYAYQHSHGGYFKWAAHDDYCAPDLIERCLKELESDPAIIGAYTRHHVVDGSGEIIGEGGTSPNLASYRPEVRAAEVLFPQSGSVPPWVIFGVLRRSVLDRTHLHGSYTGSDRALLLELALRGPMYEIDDRLFYNREHAGRSIRISNRSATRSGHVREAWFDTGRAGKIVMPNWRRLGGYTTAIAKAPLSPADKARCAAVLGRWLVHGNWKRLARDLQQAMLMVVDRSRTPSLEDA